MPADVQNRQHRLFKNGIYSLLAWLFPILPTLVVTPIVVKGLGNEMYGVYVVILGFISYFFTFGIGKAAAKYVAEYKATGETEKISDIISSTILLSISLGVIATVVIAIFARTIVVDALAISRVLQETAVLALYLACANILISMMSQIFQFVLQGLQRFDRFLLLTNLSSFFLSVGSVVLIFAGYGVLALLVWTLVVAAAIGLLSFLMARKLLPEFNFSFRIKNEAWQAVWRYAASIIAYQIFGNILLLFERGWIMRRFGAEALTYYVVPMTLAMYIHMFTSSLVLALFPMVNELLAEKEKLVTLYQKSTKLILTLVIFAVISSVVGGRLFLGLWMGDDFAGLSYWLLVIHVLTFALLSINTVVWQISEGFKFASLNAFATLAWMAISIPLMITLSDKWQTSGVALARFAGVFVFIPLIFYVEKRFLGGIFWKFWVSTSGRIIFAGVLTFLAEWAVLSGLHGSWLTFLLSIIIGFAVYCSVLLLTGFMDADEKLLIKNTLLRYR